MCGYSIATESNSLFLYNCKMINSKEHSPEQPGRPLDLYSIIASVALHIVVFLGLIILARIAGSSSGSSFGGYYVDMVSPKEGASGENHKAENLIQGREKKESKKTIIEEKKESLPEAEKSLRSEKEPLKDTPNGREISTASGNGERRTGQTGGYYNMNSAGFDSTGLNQTYQEPTLNVRLRYPSGWVYVDQQRKRKLDGITFWASTGNYIPPPYIHVEVVEKYIFNPGQYKYKYDFERFTGYYNDPEELENQVSQTIYIRTGDDEDYSIKLIMEGHEAFKEFQPVFFAMVKSFRFGNSLF